MNSPVSILMPVRNEERFLPAALASLTAQTWREWELVVVDDGSTDRTPDILSRAAAADSRIRIIASSGRGLVPALNSGLACCTAPLIARMDGDDVSHPGRLQQQVSFMGSHPEIGLLATNFSHFPRRGLKVGMLGYETWQNALLAHDEILADLFVESPFVHPCVMFRANSVDAVNGYRARGWPEDYDLWLRLAAAGTRFHSLADTLFFWRDRPERSTRTMQEYAPEAFRRCKIHHLQQGYLKGVESVTLIGAGKEGRAWRRELNAAGVTVDRWIDLDPRKVGKLLHGAPVEAAESVSPGEGPMLVTIGIRGARSEVRRWAKQRGLVEGADFICVT